MLKHLLKKIFVMFSRFLGIVPSQIKALTNPFDDDAVLDLTCNNQDGFMIIDCNATPEGMQCRFLLPVTNLMHSIHCGWIKIGKGTPHTKKIVRF